jgi:sugar O-acyltransferase (sialic acid O-acetyltransferase NeuD family)
LGYLGNEKNLTSEQFLLFKFFVGIGDNKIRKKVFEFIQSNGGNFINAIHPKSVVASSVHVGSMVMIAAGVCINPLVQIGNGVICNTISSIDHECIIGDFTHIAPGAVLCGNVEVGENSFIGAGSVIRQGIKIGNNCIIGAGSVVVKDVKTGSVVMGNPSRLRS